MTIFDQPILAPREGIVVKVKNTIRDSTVLAADWLDWRTGDFRGNHVLIAHDDGEYSFLAHLKKGSIKVKRGDRARRGQINAASAWQEGTGSSAS